MWRVRYVAAAVLAVAISFSGVDVALAEFETAATGEYDPHFLFFSGGDLWRYGAFAHGGVLWSPDGLKQEGFTLKLLLAGGAYRYDAGTTGIIGQHGLAAILPGWRFKQDRHQAVVQLGLDMQTHQLSPDDPNNRLRGTHIGIRGGFDVWFQPTDSLMFSGAFSASTIEWNFWNRLQFGVWVPDFAWVGPEFHALGDLRYQQYRAGMHITGFRTDEFEWSFGAGYGWDTVNRDGAYGRMGLNFRQ